MDMKSFYNQQKYSDLKLQLSNKSVRYVHKVVLCNRNQYFAKLCDPDGGFAEAKQSVIKLKDDDPLALDAVLRFIYTTPLGELPLKKTDWRAWLNVYVTADKYLESGLKESAQDSFFAAARGYYSAPEILDIIDVLKTMSHDKALSKFAEELRKDNARTLLQSDRFRKSLDEGGREALWKQIDELSAYAPIGGRRSYYY